MMKKMMIHGILYAVMYMMLSCLVSCEHRLLTDPRESHYVRVYLDEQIKNVTCGFYNPDYDVPEYIAPVNLRTMLADPQSGEIVGESILRGNGQDERGRYIDGYIAAPAGTYNMIIHDVGSSVTRLNKENSYYDMYAYTDPLPSDSYIFQLIAGKGSEDDRIVRQPEHMFRGVSEHVVVENSIKTDTLLNAQGSYFEARSMVQSYFVQVRIKGIEWVTSAAALISGMAGSSYMHKEGAINEIDPVSLFFTAQYADKEKSRDADVFTAVLYATFNTFGKIPDRNTVLKVELIKTDGSSQVEEFELDEIFETPQVRDRQWIILDREVVVTRPEGTGGMRPGVEGWKDIDADVIM